MLPGLGAVDRDEHVHRLDAVPAAPLGAAAVMRGGRSATSSDRADAGA